MTNEADKIISEQYRIKNLDMLFWNGNEGGDQECVYFRGARWSIDVSKKLLETDKHNMNEQWTEEEKVNIWF